MNESENKENNSAPDHGVNEMNPDRELFRARTIQLVGIDGDVRAELVADPEPLLRFFDSAGDSRLEIGLHDNLPEVNLTDVIGGVVVKVTKHGPTLRLADSNGNVKLSASVSETGVSSDVHLSVLGDDKKPAVLVSWSRPGKLLKRVGIDKAEPRITVFGNTSMLSMSPNGIQQSGITERKLAVDPERQGGGLQGKLITRSDNPEGLRRFSHVRAARFWVAKCDQRSTPGDYRCTLPKGHEGAHAAHGVFKQLLAVWD